MCSALCNYASITNLWKLLLTCDFWETCSRVNLSDRNRLNPGQLCMHAYFWGSFALFYIPICHVVQRMQGTYFAIMDNSWSTQKLRMKILWRQFETGKFPFLPLAFTLLRPSFYCFSPCKYTQWADVLFILAVWLTCGVDWNISSLYWIYRIVLYCAGVTALPQAIGPTGRIRRADGCRTEKCGSYVGHDPMKWFKLCFNASYKQFHKEGYKQGRAEQFCFCSKHHDT